MDIMWLWYALAAIVFLLLSLPRSQRGSLLPSREPKAKCVTCRSAVLDDTNQGRCRECSTIMCRSCLGQYITCPPCDAAYKSGKEKKSE